MIIEISGHYGEPKASDYFFPLQKRLNELFDQKITGDYFNTIEILSIIFRVSGKVIDFGSSGPERLKYLKKDSELTIDLVFPESQWKSKDANEVKIEVLIGVKECLKQLIAKAEYINDIKNLNCLNADLEKVFTEFDK